MRLKSLINYSIPAAIFLFIWQIFAIRDKKVQFLFSSPVEVAKTFVLKILSGELLTAIVVTGFEAITGLFFGMIVGSLIGFILLYYPQKSKIANFYMLALSSIPIFAIAPMMIIWFGTDISMKIAMAFFSTVFVATTQAYKGGMSIPKNQETFFVINKAPRITRFRKLIIPNSIDWLIQSLKLNCGLSILGAFIGEFIASERGLGYLILRASGVYDTASVLAYILGILILTLAFNQVANFIDYKKLYIIRRIAS